MTYPDEYGRVPLSPREFKSRTRALQRKWGLRKTSGFRSIARNRKVKGASNSAHMLDLAADFVEPSCLFSEDAINIDCLRLGLWFVWHDTGSGFHLHCQGIAPWLA